MRKFIKAIFLFLFYFLILSLGCIILYIFYFKISINDIPAPNISNSYSYNEKMEFMQKGKFESDIVALGSSMSLNNLYSKTITDELHSDSFLNTASWGMSMKDDFLFLKILSKIHKPSTIIIASNAIDFYETDKKVNYLSLMNYLLSRTRFSIFYHLKYFNLKYYYLNFKYTKRVRSCTSDYECLGFDKYGAVNLDTTNFKINIGRWNSDYLDTKTLPYQYAYLDSISNFCKLRGIKMFFFQSPYRYGLFSIFEQKKMNILKSHIDKVEIILKKYDHYFINANEAIWDDRLFLDGIHFNKFGAMNFTEYCFHEIKKDQ